MVTFNDLKQRFMDFLYTMDFEKIDMSAMQTYAYILKTLDDIEKPGYAESLALAFGSAKIKEEVKNNA